MNKISKTQLAASLFAYFFFFAFSQVIFAQNRLDFAVMASYHRTKSFEVKETEFTKSYKVFPSYSIQAIAKARLSNHLSLSFGLGYAPARVKYMLEITYLDTGQGAMVNSRTFQDARLRLVEVPLVFRFHLKSVTNGWFMGIGFTPGIDVLTKVDNYTVDREGQVISARPTVNISTKSKYLTPHVCLGNSFRLNDPLALSLELFANPMPGTIQSDFYLELTAGIRAGLWF